MTLSSARRASSRPSLRDPVLVWASLAALALAFHAGWRPAWSASALGVLAAIVLLICRVGREFRFARWTDGALRRSERECRLLADGCADVVVEIELKAPPRCLFVSSASRAVLGRAVHDLVGRPPPELVHPEDGPAFAAYLAAVEACEAVPPLLCRAPAHSDGDVWLEATARGSTQRDGIVVVFRDVTRLRQAELQLERANSQLRRLMLCDELTGIANRRCFDVLLHKEARRLARTGQWMSLLLIDVDRFVAFHDIYGSPAGAGLFSRLALAVSGAAARPADLAARFGDQILAVLLPETDRAGALEVAERVRVAVRRLQIVHCGNPDRLVTVSIGLADERMRGHAQPATLVHRAQTLLTQAVEAGGDRVCAEFIEEALCAAV